MVATASEFFSKPPSPDEEQEFWAAIRLPNRCYKTTLEGRLDDVNQLALSHWLKTGFVPNRMLDVGASSGITSIEWLDTVEKSGFKPGMTATDIVINARILRALSFYSVLVGDAPGRAPLQYAILSHPIRPYLAFGFRSLIGSVTAISLYRILRLLRMPMETERVVKLISPRVISQDRITFEEDDIFEKRSDAQLKRFDVARAANLLNLDVFPKKAALAAVRNIKAMLGGPGSYFIAVRTAFDGGNHGTIFRLTAADRFEAVAAIGNGSELAELVLLA